MQKECQKTNHEKCLKWPWDIMRYYEILITLHAQSKLQGKIFKLVKFCNKRTILKSSKQMTLSIRNGKRPKPSSNTSNFWLKLFQNGWKLKLIVLKNGTQEWKTQSFSCLPFKWHICLEITCRSVEAMKKEHFANSKKKVSIYTCIMSLKVI